MKKNFANFWLLFIPAVCFLYGSLFIAIWIRYPSGLPAEDLQEHLQAFTIVFAVWLLILFAHNVFDVEALRRRRTYVLNVFVGFGFCALAAVAYFYAQPGLILTPRRFLLIVLLVSWVLVSVWGAFIRHLLKTRLVEHYYLLPLESDMRLLERELQESSHLGVRYHKALALSDLDNTQTLEVGSVIVPDSPQLSGAALIRLFHLRQRGFTFYNYRRVYERLFRRVYLSELTELWFLENVSYQKKRWYNLVKRVFDLIIGVVAFLVFIITFPIIAVLIRMDSAGPIIFRQKRVGKIGEIFTIYKYRTMRGEGNTWTQDNDPRITRVGKVLRLTRLDELPQSLNLIAGHMTVVGPRPEQVGIVEALRKQIPFYDERHLVKPGLTGWAQLHVYAATLEETKRKLEYDLYYIKERSLLFDFEIILKTFYYLIRLKGK